MAHSGLTQRLSSLDASFLYLEKPEAPLHIGSVALFDGEIPFERFVEHVESKLPRLPRYRQKVTPAPFGLGHPSWEPDPDFDIQRHIFRTEVDAPGTEAELSALGGRLLSGMMDRSKPLWELYLIYGLQGNRSAMVTKVHHAMVDGISSVELMNTVFDITPNPPPPTTKQPWAPTPTRDITRQMTDAILDSTEEMMESWTQFQLGLVNMAQTMMRPEARAASNRLRDLVPSLTTPPQLLPFNRPLTGQRNLVWNEFPFAEARAIRAALGGTVNDVVLTVLSDAISRYVAHHGEPTAERTVRFMVPVSMRREEQRGTLGNLVSILPVEIPLDLAGPVERLRYVTLKTGAMKAARLAEGINIWSALSGATPPWMQALIGSLANTVVPPFNMVCTNVPGPQVPLYALGVRMIGAYPYVPIGYAIGCSCAILSYDQKLTFGLTSDEGAMPDVKRLNEFVAQAFTDLRQAAGVPEMVPIATLSRVKVSANGHGSAPAPAGSSEAPPMEAQAAAAILPEVPQPAGSPDRQATRRERAKKE